MSEWGLRQLRFEAMAAAATHQQLIRAELSVAVHGTDIPLRSSFAPFLPPFYFLNRESITVLGRSLEK